MSSELSPSPLKPPWAPPSHDAQRRGINNRCDVCRAVQLDQANGLAVGRNDAVNARAARIGRVEVQRKVVAHNAVAEAGTKAKSREELVGIVVLNDGTDRRNGLWQQGARKR